MRNQTHRVLEGLRLPNGLYVASLSDAYQFVWIRDTCYIALTYLNQPCNRYQQTFHAMLDIFRKYEWKLKHHAQTRPLAVYEYIHPRYDARTLEEVREPWGNAQNDAIGLFLYGVAEGERRGKQIIRDDIDLRIIRHLVNYLGVLEFWRDPDHGMWEESREVHASSIGACMAGIRAVSEWVDVEDAKMWYDAGEEALRSLLPSESSSKECDLALLSLIYPYRLLESGMALDVVTRVEKVLKRQHGVIRYQGDAYYSEDGLEAEWCFGFPWLGLCWQTLGDEGRARSYLKETEHIMFAPGVLPELYRGQSKRPNANTPLGWANAMYLQLFEAIYGVVSLETM